MRNKQLKKLIYETIREIKAENQTLHERKLRSGLRKAKWLIEGEDPEKSKSSDSDKKEKPPSAPPLESGYAIVNPSTNIGEMDPTDAYQQLVSGDENMPLVQAMRNSTDWSDEAISSAGGAPGIKKWANSIGDENFQQRVNGVSAMVPPAPEPVSLEKPSDSNMELVQKPQVNQKDLSDKALSHVTSEKLSDSEEDYGFDINVGASVNNAKLTPTSHDIKAGKSLMFGFLHDSPDSEVDLADMDGAYITSDNEVLDGNHRWAGGNISTGGDLRHGNLNVVKGAAADVTPDLVALGTGLDSEPEELGEELDEAITLGNLAPEMQRITNKHASGTKALKESILDRWKIIAGL